MLLVTHHPPSGIPAENVREVRSNLKAWLSDDDGDSWYGGLLIDGRPGISYPDGVETEDGFLVIYDRDRYDTGDILIASFSDKAVANGGSDLPLARATKTVSRLEVTNIT